MSRIIHEFIQYAQNYDANQKFEIGALLKRLSAAIVLNKAFIVIFHRVGFILSNSVNGTCSITSRMTH